MKIRYILKHFVFRISRAFYHARKFLAVFGLCLILLFSFFATSASADVVTGSGYLTEGDQPLTIGTGTVFAQYVNNSTYYMLHDIPAVPPQDKITTKGLIGSYVPSNCTFFNLGFETDMENVFFAFSNQNPIKPGDVITFSCKVDCIFNEYTDDKQNLSSLKSFNFIIRFFYEDDFYERVEVRTAVEKVNGVALCTLTFKNTTGRNLSLYNLKVAGVFDAGSYTGCNFRLYDLRYHLYTSQELSNIETFNSWNGQGKPPSGSGTVSDLDNAEQNLIAESSEGFNHFTDIMNGLSGRFDLYSSSFAAVGNFFMDIAYIPFFTALLYISMAFGIFALIVNLALSLERADRRAVKEKNKKNRNNKQGGGS